MQDLQTVAAPADAAPAAPGAAAESAAPRFTSESQGLTAMADALVARGALSRESATEMLAAELASLRGEPGGEPGGQSAAPGQPAGTPAPEGAPTVGDPAPGALTSSSPTPDEIDLATLDIDPLFAPPETPEGYALALNPGVQIDPAGIAEVRGWFHALRLPAPIAQSLYSEVERMSLAPPDEAAITRMNAATLSELNRAWGERTEAMLGQARRLIDSAARKQPGLKAALARGPGSNPLVVRQLAEHAERLYGSASPRPAQGEH